MYRVVPKVGALPEGRRRITMSRILIFILGAIVGVIMIFVFACLMVAEDMENEKRWRE